MAARLVLLDTNIVSYLLKKTEPQVVARFRATPAAQRAISVITEAELWYGLAKAPFSIIAHRAVPEFLTEISIRPWDSGAAISYGRLRAAQEKIGRPIHTLDLQIAAHALALGAILVTRDASFANIPGLICEDWAQS
jgi:tRNA(fMet)-specific endonuclease VapC